MTTNAAAETPADAESCCQHPAPALCPSILLSHDGTAFVAQLLGSTGPKGRGSSYRAALESLEKLLAIGRETATGSQSDGFGLVRRRPQRRQYVPTLKARLIMRFGPLSNRELAARIGVVEQDAASMLSGALGGQGTRPVRCAIALALSELPSALWPNRSDKLRQGDDAAYQTMVSEQAKGSLRSNG